MASCQKFRHFLFIAFLAIAVSSCGKSVNKAPDYDKLRNINAFMEADSTCKKTQSMPSPIVKDINILINKIFTERRPLLGSYTTQANYTFLNPLVVSESILRKMYAELEKQFKTQNVSLAFLENLQNMAARYEGMKCQFSNLTIKSKDDLRSYLYFLHQCKIDENTGDCETKSINDLFAKNFSLAKDNYFDLCQSIDRPLNCVEQANVAFRAKKLPEVTKFYMQKFKEAKFDTLFVLAENYARFNCQKINNTEVSMNVNVLNKGITSYIFNTLIDSINSTWSKNGLNINFTETNSEASADLILVPVENQISHVNLDNTKVMYLDTHLPLYTLQRVTAHEFGHVLGFPDCYIEFYDTKTYSLVYYELSSENKNIMCSLKNGSEVLGSYIDQIKSKSCKF